MRFTTLIVVLYCGFFSCTSKSTLHNTTLPIYTDAPFWQEYSVKYYADPANSILKKVATDRNGVVKIVSDKGLLQPTGGQFLYAGKLHNDDSYRPLKDKKIASIGTYQDQLIYLDDKTLLSNAWAGKLLSPHTLPQARMFVGGKDFAFLLANNTDFQLIKGDKILWKSTLSEPIVDLRYQPTNDIFWLLTTKALYAFNPVSNALEKKLEGESFTAFDFAPDGFKIFIGTTNGYWVWNTATQKTIGDIQRKIPVTDITTVEAIGDKIWFGTSNGAFALRADSKFDYYNGERWLPTNQVVDIAKGSDNSVLILTQGGLGKICFKQMTLYDKAVFYDKQVRTRHIRNGFNASLSGMEKGNIASGFLSDSDNDGLWTSMYLGGEIFRYAVTKSPEALQNCRESLDAMERLYTINPVPGFPSRSFERRGYIARLSDPERWQPSPDPNWDWKATTSSDEAIGHIFAFGAMAELIDDPDLKSRSIALIDTLMAHIVKNNLYLIDYNGKPTLWGKWNPEYVNAFPTNVGDRKLNSSNIIAMLQTAYHFTKKEKYKQTAFDLMNKHGYLTNLRRPINQIGKAEDAADDYSKMLSDGWNHSDDEMYFLGYWGLYRYAFNDTLKQIYKDAIIDHWQAERPEKEGLWDIFTAMVSPQFDLDEATWYLREYPLDLIDWGILNSHRKDIEKVAPNFRNQTTKEVLPPDEIPIQRHNANTFALDRKGGNGLSEHSAGDIWLLPYWLGRYLGVISTPTVVSK